MATNTQATKSGTGKSTPQAGSLSAFFSAVNHALGVPDTSGTQALELGWSQVENTKANYNPLATSQTAKGATTFNSSGVKNYPDFQTGVQATAQTIRGYPHIYAALQTGSPIVGGLNNGLIQDFTRWVNGGKDPAAGAAYARHVWLAAQGNPSGKTAADWTSGNISDIASAAGNAATSLFDKLGFGDVAKAILYATTIAGGSLLMITGLVLIGVDLRGGSVPTSPLAVVSDRRSAKAAAANAADQEEAERIYREHRNNLAKERAETQRQRRLEIQNRRTAKQRRIREAKKSERIPY